MAIDNFVNKGEKPTAEPLVYKNIRISYTKCKIFTHIHQHQQNIKLSNNRTFNDIHLSTGY